MDSESVYAVNEHRFGRERTRLALRYRPFSSAWSACRLGALLLCVGLGLATAPADAAFPGQNGKIAFVKGVPSNDIYTIDPGGSGPRNLTLNSLAAETEPTFSPDGKKIAFSSDRDGNTNIYVMNADGSGATRVTDDAAEDGDPAFSPDGTKIAFSTRRDGNREIYTLNMADGLLTRLTNESAFDNQPVFSPDGKKIVFTSGRDENPEIYVMNADGSQQTRLTDDPHFDFAASFSPDGRSIVFSSTRDQNAYELFVMNADGSGVRQLTQTRAGDSSAKFSPDGTKIAFQSHRDGNYEIYTMNADGTSPSNQTNDMLADDFAPDWGPVPGTWPGDVRISELRLRGAGGPNDEFVEITNRETVPRGIGGWTLEACDSQGNASTVATVPPDRTLQPGQSYLFNGQGYQGIQDQELTADLPDSGQAGMRLRVFQSGVVSDGVGSPTSPCREGTGLSLPQGDGNTSFVRKTAANQFVDTDDNAADFDFVSPTAGMFDSVQSKLGVIGSSKMADPRRLSFGFRPGLFDATQTSSGSNNRSFSSTGFGGDRGSQGVLRVRRSFTNTGSQPVNDLRLRVHRLTTKENRSAGQADLRLIDSAAETRTVSGGSRTALATSFEQKDQCPAGTGEASHCGGLNARATVALPAPVAPGETVYFNLDFAVATTGAFSLFLVPEALP